MRRRSMLLRPAVHGYHSTARSASEAMTLVPHVYERARADGRPRPESSTLFFMWSAVEDLIMEAWLEFVVQELAHCV
jgi:hypothetical protein